jgi:hypothetical protein
MLRPAEFAAPAARHSPVAMSSVRVATLVTRSSDVLVKRTLMVKVESTLRKRDGDN